MNARELIKFFRGIKGIYKDWQESQRQYQEGVRLGMLLMKANLPSGAAYNIGTALELARDLGIELYGGLTFSDCRAVLPKSAFKFYPKRTGLFYHGQFTGKPFDKVIDIQAIDRNVCFAITKCVLSAKAGGVL